MNISIVKTVFKALFILLALALKGLASVFLFVLSNAAENESDPFAVDYPNYAPSADKPGNIAMHDLLHHSH